MASMLVIEKNCINKCPIIDGRRKVVNVKKVSFFLFNTFHLCMKEAYTRSRKNIIFCVNRIMFI